MTGALGEALPWPNSDKANRAKTGETTSGGREAIPWIVVAANLNPGEAMVIKGRLESEDIPAIIQQEAVGTVLGLTVGPLGSAKVLVPEPLSGRAQSILAETYDDEVEDEPED